MTSHIKTKMADPKYANLPGIAHDQPDVFETNELPEADQHLDNFEENSDAVETLHISANEAFGRFKGKNLEANKVDFSDRIRGTKRKGYVAWSGEYETGTSDDETPLQRYQRLNCEVRELLEELGNLREASSEKMEPIGGLAQQVKGLHDQLSSLRLEEVLGSDLLRNLSDPQGLAKEKLMHQLEEFGQTSKAKGDAKDSKSGGGGEATYELFLKPELSKLQDQVKLAQLDKRLEKLEKVIGGSDEQLGSLSMETNQKSIVGAIGVLSSRTSLLDPGHLDHVEGRLFALQQKMNAVAEKKQVIEDTEKQNKISELYELVQKSDGMSSALPEIVDRLETLEGLHDQALQFTKALSQLDSVQEQLKHNLDNNAALLTETQKKFAENLGNIQQNFTAVEKRLEKLGN